MRLDDAVELRAPVAAGDEQRTVEEVRETGAEDVVTLIDRGGCMGTRNGVVDGGSRKVVNGKGLRRRIADGVEREDFAVRKHRHVNADDGPGGDRAPFPDLPGIGRDDLGGRQRRPRRLEPGAIVEHRLARCAVDDRVFGLMTRRSVDVVRLAGARNTKGGRLHQRHEERSTDRPSASTRRMAAKKAGRKIHREHSIPPRPCRLKASFCGLNDWTGPVSGPRVHGRSSFSGFGMRRVALPRLSVAILLPRRATSLLLQRRQQTREPA